MFLSAKTISLLNRPFEMSVRMKGGWHFVLALSVLIPLCLYIQQPYGISRWQQTHKALGLAGFGLVFLLIYFFTYDVLPRYCTKFYAPANWTVRRELLVTLLFFGSLGFSNWLYEGLLVEETKLTACSLLKLQFFTFSYGLGLKITKVLLLRVHYLFPVAGTHTPPPVENPGQQADESHLPRHTIQYLNSHKNNITTYHYQHGNQYLRTSRCTMIQAENNLKAFPHFVRCHNSFIVNMHHVDLAKSRGLKNRLYIKNINVEIRVSKSYQAAIKEILLQ
jgi:hypothetical protein